MRECPESIMICSGVAEKSKDQCSGCCGVVGVFIRKRFCKIKTLSATVREAHVNRVYSPPGSRRYRRKVRPARLHEMPKDISPVISGIPGDAVWRVDFNRHDLTDLAALDENDRRPDTPALATPIFATPDVVCDEWVVVRHVCAWNDVSAFHGESKSSAEHD